MIREWRERDLPELTTIWDQVVEAGCFFPDVDRFDEAPMRRMA